MSELTQIPVEKPRLLVYNYWYENEYIYFIYAVCVIITVKENHKEKDVHECALILRLRKLWLHLASPSRSREKWQCA